MEQRCVWTCIRFASLGVLIMASVFVPAIARADSFSWSAPIALARTGGAEPLVGVSCLAGVGCTAVDARGQQVTFKPSSPGNPNPTVIDPGQAPAGVSCASSTQCTAVDFAGNEVTFDPSTG